MKQSIVIGLAIGVMMASVYAVYELSQSATASNPSTVAQSETVPVVTVVNPKTITAASNIEFPARLAPKLEASIFAKNTGFVSRSHVDIGSKVKANQTLATLAAPELQAALMAAMATQKQREAEYTLANSNLKRAMPLANTGAVSPQQLDEIKSGEQMSKALLDVAKAEVARLRTETQYLNITAPFDGIITERNINKGDKVNANGSERLYRIINNQIIRVLVDIPQPQWFQVREAKTASLLLSEKPGLNIPVRFKRSANEINETTGTVRVEYEFDNRTLALPAGLNGIVKMTPNAEDTSAINTVVVPSNTILYRTGKATVVVLTPASTIEYRTVKLGKNEANSVEVLEGLTPKEKIVVNPNALLKEGQTVQVKSKDT